MKNRQKFENLTFYTPKDKDKTSPKGQLNSELINEVIVSHKKPTKNYHDFCPGSLLEGREETLVIFWLAF